MANRCSLTFLTKIILLLACLSIGAPTSYAGVTPVTAPNASALASAGNLLSGTTNGFNPQQLASFTSQVQSAGVGMAENFIPDAQVLLNILGGIAFAWLGIMILLSEADIWHMGARPLFVLIFTFGLTRLFLNEYATLAPMVVHGFIYSGKQLIGSGVNGSAWSIGGLFFQQFWSVIKDVMGALPNMFMATIGSGATAASAPASGLSEITNLAHSVEPSVLLEKIGDLFFVAIDFFLSLFVLSLALVLLLLAAVIFIVTYIIYQITIGVAIAVGPVFIPFLVLPVTKFLFEGWLRFLILSGVYIMSSYVLAGLLADGLKTFASTIMIVSQANTTTAPLVNFGNLLELAIFALAAAWSMLKIPEYAHAMVGSLSLGGLNVAGKMAGAGKAAVSMGK